MTYLSLACVNYTMYSNTVSTLRIPYPMLHVVECGGDWVGFEHGGRIIPPWVEDGWPLVDDTNLSARSKVCLSQPKPEKNFLKTKPALFSFSCKGSDSKCGVVFSRSFIPCSCQPPTFLSADS